MITIADGTEATLKDKNIHNLNFSKKGTNPINFSHVQTTSNTQFDQNTSPADIQTPEGFLFFMGIKTGLMTITLELCFAYIIIISIYLQLIYNLIWLTLILPLRA